jgi:hypothetical protein
LGPTLSFFFFIKDSIFCYVRSQRRKRTHVLEEHNPLGLSAKPNKVNDTHFEIEVSKVKEVQETQAEAQIHTRGDEIAFLSVLN